MDLQRVMTPASVQLNQLVQRLQNLTEEAASESEWPAKSLEACAQAGVFEWFVSRSHGGQEWTQADLIRGYLALSMGCLTTAFIITQRTGACQRIERSDNRAVQQRLLPGLLHGALFATVGISHLTTSRRHLDRPVLYAESKQQGFVLDGYSPWVTGADHSQYIVVGATLDDQRQILIVVPTDTSGVVIPAPESLVGLSGSHTGRVEFKDVFVGSDWLLAGPVVEVMTQGVGARTGGLQTSTLALGLAKRAIDYLHAEAITREVLNPPAAALAAEWQQVLDSLLAAAENRPVCSDADLRTRANSLVLRSTQAALTAAKGAGYVAGHPAGRWCREALFFLVWSCPQPVLNANLCEFAGLDG